MAGGLLIALATGVVQNVLVQGNSSPPGGIGGGITKPKIEQSRRLFGG